MMNTKTKPRDCVDPCSKVVECVDVPCKLDPPCRPAYYAGKLLTETDFNLEQKYHIDKHRLHNLALHGWGTAYGLKIKPHQRCPDKFITIEPGLAIDCCGREIQVHGCVDVRLPQPPPPPAPDPCEPGKPEEQPPEHHEKVWICIRYCEKETEFAPAPFDECNCGGIPEKPNRVCESFCVDVHTEEPKCFKHHHDCECECEDCCDLFREGLNTIPSPESCSVPLAIIERYTPGCKVEAEMIRDYRERAALPSVHTLDRLVRCILEKLPTHKLTHISDINWTHGEKMDCHELHRRFVDQEGFTLTFDGPVHHRGINERTFQAMIVFNSGPRAHHVEVAPSKVELIDHRRCHLRMSRDYAHGLHGQDFDLFLTLKCNVILDEHGHAVDGNLLARLGEDGNYVVDAPTGDGVPGGLFESWVRVHHHPPSDE